MVSLALAPYWLVLKQFSQKLKEPTNGIVLQEIQQAYLLQSTAHTSLACFSRMQDSQLAKRGEDSSREDGLVM